jgi:hypothetical protein
MFAATTPRRRVAACITRTVPMRTPIIKRSMGMQRMSVTHA